ncbi:hypothetical protein MMPV_009540 [Pyropia vietnamensis]
MAARHFVASAVSRVESLLSAHAFVLTFLLLYALANTILFFAAATPERLLHPDGSAHSWIMPIARGAGNMLNLNAFLILLLAARATLTAARATPLNMVVPFDKAMPAGHTAVAYVLLGAACVHVGAHIVAYSIRADWTGGFTGRVSLMVSGVALVGVLVFIRGTSFRAVRARHFEVFFWAHAVGGTAFFVLLVLHGMHYGKPHTVKWVVVSLAVYAIDRIVRAFRTQRCKVLLSRASVGGSAAAAAGGAAGSRNGSSRAAAVNGGVGGGAGGGGGGGGGGRRGNDSILCLRFPRAFDYVAGQYAELCVPAISRIEWHPFTIASAPHESEMVFYIKRNGDWTAKLYDLFANAGGSTPAGGGGGGANASGEFSSLDGSLGGGLDGASTISFPAPGGGTAGTASSGGGSGGSDDIVVHLRGPHGSPAQHVGQFSHVVLIGGGVGATPFCSVVKAAHHWMLNWTARGGGGAGGSVGLGGGGLADVAASHNTSARTVEGGAAALGLEHNRHSSSLTNVTSAGGSAADDGGGTDTGGGTGGGGGGMLGLGERTASAVAAAAAGLVTRSRSRSSATGLGVSTSAGGGAPSTGASADGGTPAGGGMSPALSALSIASSTAAVIVGLAASSPGGSVPAAKLRPVSSSTSLAGLLDEVDGSAPSSTAPPPSSTPPRSSPSGLTRRGSVGGLASSAFTDTSSLTRGVLVRAASAGEGRGCDGSSILGQTSADQRLSVAASRAAVVEELMSFARAEDEDAARLSLGDLAAGEEGNGDGSAEGGAGGGGTGSADGRARRWSGLMAGSSTSRLAAAIGVDSDVDIKTAAGIGGPGGAGFGSAISPVSSQLAARVVQPATAPEAGADVAIGVDQEVCDDGVDGAIVDGPAQADREQKTDSDLSFDLENSKEEAVNMPVGGGTAGGADDGRLAERRRRLATLEHGGGRDGSRESDEESAHTCGSDGSLGRLLEDATPLPPCYGMARREGLHPFSRTIVMGGSAAANSGGGIVESADESSLGYDEDDDDARDDDSRSSDGSADESGEDYLDMESASLGSLGHLLRHSAFLHSSAEQLIGLSFGSSAMLRHLRRQGARDRRRARGGGGRRRRTGSALSAGGGSLLGSSHSLAGATSSALTSLSGMTSTGDRRHAARRAGSGRARRGRRPWYAAFLRPRLSIATRIGALQALHSVTASMLLVWLVIARFALVAFGRVFGALTPGSAGLAMYNQRGWVVADLVLAAATAVPLTVSVALEWSTLGGVAYLSSLGAVVDAGLLLPLAWLSVGVAAAAAAGAGAGAGGVAAGLRVGLLWPGVLATLVYRLIRVIGSRVLLAPNVRATHSDTRSLDFVWTAQTQADDSWLVSELLPLCHSGTVRLHRYITRAAPAVESWMLDYERIPLRTNYRRPDWDEVFAGIAERSKSGTTVGIFFCGPHTMSAAVQEAARGAMTASIVKGLRTGALSGDATRAGGGGGGGGGRGGAAGGLWGGPDAAATITAWSAAVGSVRSFFRRGTRRPDAAGHTDGAAAAAGEDTPEGDGGDGERGRPKADTTGTASLGDSYGANVRFAFREENFS